MYYFRLPPQSSWELCCPGLLCSDFGDFLAEQPISPILRVKKFGFLNPEKSQNMSKKLTLLAV